MINFRTAVGPSGAVGAATFLAFIKIIRRAPAEVKRGEVYPPKQLKQEMLSQTE